MQPRMRNAARCKRPNGNKGGRSPGARCLKSKEDVRSILSLSARGLMNDPYQQIPEFYEAVTTSEIEAENMPEQERLPDTDGDTLPFTQLGGPRLEILAYYLLSGDPLNPQPRVILVKSSGDQGRDLLVFVEGDLQTIVQCKNLMTRWNHRNIAVPLSQLKVKGYGRG